MSGWLRSEPALRGDRAPQKMRNMAQRRLRPASDQGRGRARGIGAVLLVLAGLSMDEAPAGAADASREAAREHYNRGVELATKGQYLLASDEFKAAYEASPNFATLHNIAQAELALGRVEEAIEVFRRYLREGGDQIPVERREQVARHLALLEARFGALTIDTDPPGATVQVDGAEIGTTPLPSPLRLRAGTHAVSASRAGHQPVTKAVTLGEGEGQRIALSLPKVVVVAGPAAPSEHAAPLVAPGRDGRERTPASPSWTARPAYWLIAGGALAGGAAGVLYAWNRGRYGQYQDEEAQLQTDTTPGRLARVMAHNALGDSIHRTSVATVSLVVAGAVLAVAGTGWLVVDARRPKDAANGERTHTLALDLAPDRAALLWSGAW